MIEFNERTPFYFVSTVFLLITIILSMYSTFLSNKNCSDFFPVPYVKNNKIFHDETFVDKLCWYFSQITHHTIFLLFAYFVMALLNRKQETYFKMVAPLALTISVLYFYFLYPKQSLSVHQLPFYNFFSHFMIIFLVFGEFIYIQNYSFKETTYCFIFILTALLAIFINYMLRGVWSYNLIKLDRYSGWKLVAESTIIMYLFSFMFFFFKYRGRTDNKEQLFSKKTLNKTILFFSGILNIIFVLLFEYFDKNEDKLISFHNRKWF